MTAASAMLDTARNAAGARAVPTVDFNLHGLAGVRLLDASPGDVAAVSRQLGLVAAPFTGEPDLAVRFVDKLPLASPLDQHDQQVHWLPLEPDGAPVSPQLVGWDVKLEVAEAKAQRHTAL